jgi:methylmalonyl-CoA mutase cobalamin-binding subunit
MLSRLHRPAHRADVNWAPLFDVMVVGTPNPDTQSAKRALSQSAAVMDLSGIASGHLEVQLMTVNR